MALSCGAAFATNCYEEVDPYYWTFDVPSMIHVGTPQDAAQVRASVVNYMWGGRGFPDAQMPATVQHLPCAGDPPPILGPFPSDFPTTFPGLVLWLDATDPTSFALRSQHVSQWRDKSGMQNHAAQGVHVQQPLVVANGIGGKPAVSFDGLDDALNVQGNASLDVTSLSVFVVLRFTNPDNETYPVILAKLPVNDAFVLSLDADNTPIARVNILGTWLSTQDMDPVGASPEIWSTVHDGQVLRLFRNRWQSELAPVALGALGTTTGPLRIGDGATVDPNGFAGVVSEILLYDRPLAEADRKQIENYLGWKYGIYQAWPKWIGNIGSANVDCVDRLDVALDYEMHAYAYLLHPKNPVGRFLIYHQGHDDFLLSGGGGRTMKHFLDRGFDIEAFWMPLFGENSKTAYGVPDKGTVTFAWHSPMKALENSRGSFLRFFLEPVFVGINHAEATLSPLDINMTGISGGGWTTHLIPALDTRVGLSFPVAGSLPIYLRSGPCPNGSDGDAEQVYPPFYEQRATWPDLYALAGYGPKRRQIQVLNQYDSCCFWGVNYRTYDTYVTNTVAGLGSGEYGVYLDASHNEHKISDAVLETVIDPAISAQVLPYRPETDLAVGQSDSPDPALVGEPLTYQVRIDNQGPSKARGVALTDTLPGSATLLSATPSQGTCAGSGPVTCALGSIAEGGTATVAIVVSPTGTGSVANVTSVTYEYADFRPGNDTSSEATLVGRAGDRDGDGVADGSDCAPLDPGAFAVPVEVSGLRFEADRETLAWDSGAPGAGPGTVHDLMRGDLAELPVGSGAEETCVAARLPGGSQADASIPLGGTGFWYLARGRNACGMGTYGSRTGGPERASAACP
jgi:uncharacterized repeat protein (TIGR01451 family)